MNNVGLVLQGGGLRGVYTSGVLDYFLKKGICFPYVIGVSSGACNGAVYVAGQTGLGRKIYTEYIQDRRAMSYSNLFIKGSLFSMEYIFEELPKHIVPFDHEKLRCAQSQFWVVATNCQTGKPVYFEKSSCKEIFRVISASCSLPFISRTVQYEGMELLDGGIADPIPIKKSICDGNSKNVIIMTNQIIDHEKPFWFSYIARKTYSKYKELYLSLCGIYDRINENMAYMSKLSCNNQAFVIMPSRQIQLKTLEKDTDKLNELYELGYMDAENLCDKMLDWLDDSDNKKPGNQSAQMVQ